MTPAARVAAAIEVLDACRAGQAAEQALTRWARKSRFAGSKDRAAVRDHVYDVLRSKQSAMRLGGGETGRALMIGLLRLQNLDPDRYFTGTGHAPDVLRETERQCATPQDADPDWNLPAWLIEEFEASLGDRAFDTARLLRDRGPVTIRVNAAVASVATIVDALEKDGVATRRNPLSPTALTVTVGARRLRQSPLYQKGAFELQDASSQAVVDTLPSAGTCLDFCAGGGGKSLAMAAQPNRLVFAHDIDPERMQDLKTRAERAGVTIPAVATDDLAGKGPFDLVLCDAPCSGSGAWRRSPEAKWTLTPERLDALCKTQLSILHQASQLISQNGCLAYATCSVLRAENESIVDAFLSSHIGWTCDFHRRFDVSEDGDGFFTAHLTQVDC
ncbi:MAG: RsmB/NOP family class I SAM-dependent RNA methyltransferase [Roseobacter sp.]|jgi:16S rRNA (cytosine967-C5)-methyltransferase